MNINQKIETSSNNINRSYSESITNTEMLVKISKILKILANEDALLIFSITKDGMEADTLTCNKVGLTRKQYYTRLMELKHEGLIEKKENCYHQTTLGSFVYENCVGILLTAIKNRNYMSMLDVLVRSNFLPEDVATIKNAICNVDKSVIVTS